MDNMHPWNTSNRHVDTYTKPLTSDSHNIFCTSDKTNTTGGQHASMK